MPRSGSQGEPRTHLCPLLIRRLKDTRKLSVWVCVLVPAAFSLPGRDKVRGGDESAPLLLSLGTDCALRWAVGSLTAIPAGQCSVSWPLIQICPLFCGNQRCRNTRLLRTANSLEQADKPKITTRKEVYLRTRWTGWDQRGHLVAISPIPRKV